MSKVNRFFVAMCCFVMSFVFAFNCSAKDSGVSSVQTKADVAALLSTLSVSELITVGHEVLRLSKEQGLPSSAAEKLFRNTLEVIYEDVYVYDAPAPVVYEDVYVYDTPAPVFVDFSVGSGSSSSQHLGPKTTAEQVAAVIVAVLGVTLTIVIVGIIVYEIATRGFEPSGRVIRREIHVPAQPVRIQRVHHF